MKLVKATIYGFGVWVDKTIEFPEFGPTLVYGENESGKSTLHAFLLFMLFGLGPKQRQSYQPRTSGKMGGSLTVNDPEVGMFTIERMDSLRNGAAICYADSGAEHDEAWLKSRLKGMTEKTYQSIFSFSASDLSGLPKMKEEDLGEVLLGIGLTGSTDIHAFETSLENKINQLFKPSGKKPIINEQLFKLDTSFSELQKTKALEATYREKKERIEELTDSIVSLKQTLQDKKISLTSQERKLEALPDIQRYVTTVKRLKGFPQSIRFPEDGLNRMQQVKEQLLPIQSEFVLLQDHQKKYREQLDRIEESKLDMDEGKVKHAYILKKQTEEYNTRKKEVDYLLRQIEQLQDQIDQELSQLHIGLTKKELEDIKLPFHVEKSWSQLKKEQDSLALEQAKHIEENHQIKQERVRLLAQAESLEVTLLSEERIRELKSKEDQLAKNSILESKKSKASGTNRTWKEWKQKKVKAYQSILLFSMAVAVLFAVIGIMSENYIYYVVSGVSLVFGMLQWGFGKKSLIEIEAFADTKENQFLTIEEKREASQQLQEHERATREIATIEAQLKSLDQTFTAWQEKGKEIQEKQNVLDNKTIKERQQHNYLADIDVTYWPDLHHKLKHIIRLSAEKKRQQNSLQQLQETQQKFSSNLNAFLDSLERETLNIEDKLTFLEEWIKEYETMESHRGHYRKLYKETTEQLQHTEKKLAVYKEAYNELLDYAEVEEENAFYERASLLTERRQLQEEAERLEEQLQSMLVTEDKISLQLPDETEMMEFIKASKQRITWLEKDLERKREQLAEVKSEINQLEASGQFSEALHAFTMEKEELQQSVRKWAVLKTAKGMLEETKRQYRDKYLTKVMEKTSEYFKLMTGSKYRKVYPPMEGRLFQVETTDHIRYNVQELSQGTKDQLYIALRIAISNIMNDKHKLPFLLDDAFVHFDSIRTENMFYLLDQLSETQQVILFTCKEELIKYFDQEKIIQLKNSVRIN
ncbi:AAA family ATPase [Oceanobacillus kapialis]|uniref:AAA family ATPase n=1 Tax=Oceanobacillus kapialis TaxID=481353 RepID=UPI003850B427